MVPITPEERNKLVSEERVGSVTHGSQSESDFRTRTNWTAPHNMEDIWTLRYTSRPTEAIASNLIGPLNFCAHIRKVLIIS